MTAPRPGDVVLVGAACSVQFTGERELTLRVVSVGEVDPYTDWMWITGYVLDVRGLAKAKRELYVMRAGLRIQRRTAPAVGQPRRSGAPVTT
ncbi:hypothetical protein [Micromonospora tarensis]|uniref:Uncharacterized protein n=1 Tax=Micromonospora tarensis TaxID=2806100 RepID=A0ABS1YFN5_9ACTN|nr:hypothetical protein [Micromonospora tarensis]MBM0276044.1 hypothetical protein [Micromonospora tarensis]